MKICVFGAASAHIDDIYVKKIEELSEVMTALTKLTIEVGTLLFAIKLVIMSLL